MIATDGSETSMRTAKLAIGLAKRLWSVHNYVCYPVHVCDLQRALWAEQREILLTTGLNGQNTVKLY